MRDSVTPTHGSHSPCILAMPIHPIYKDFFRFLDCRSKGDPWEIYRQYYLNPHGRFFEQYWKGYDHFDSSQIAQRVRRIKVEDYGQLRACVRSQNPEAAAKEAMERCQATYPLSPEPSVFLMVGFFSADAMTMDIDGKPSIVIGLERFKDFSDLPLLVAHEYGHCIQRPFWKEEKSGQQRLLIQMIASEGLAVLFSEAVYPEIPAYRHLFLSPQRYCWCQENRQALLELAGADLASAKLVPVLFGPGDPVAGLPPRLGYFVAREMWRHCLSHHQGDDWGKFFPGFPDRFRWLMAGAGETRPGGLVSSREDGKST